MDLEESSLEVSECVKVYAPGDDGADAGIGLGMDAGAARALAAAESEGDDADEASRPRVLTGPVSAGPLPLPRWARRPPRRAPPEPLAHAEPLAGRIEALLSRLLDRERYDTVSNFARLYDAYKASGSECLREVFVRFNPKILPGHHTCVGLGIELIKLLEEIPAYLASCEEALDDARDYAADAPGPEAFPDEVEKEHVVVVVRTAVGGRRGVVVCDPGYHVGRAITVMEDRKYPHTGWFTQSEEPQCKKEYCYTFSPVNVNYVEWHERETRGGTVKMHTSLIYAARPYMTAVEVTEKRNLVYNFRSLLTRDHKGNLIAGLYFPLVLKDPMFTIFYETESGKQRVKFKFSMFIGQNKIPDSILDEINKCNNRMKYKDGELLIIIRKLAAIVHDTSYISQALDINRDICELSADN